MRFRDLTIESSMTARLRRFLLRFVDFFVRIWLLPSLLNMNFPDPVLVKRFAAERFVFSFGISVSLLKATIFHTRPERVVNTNY